MAFEKNVFATNTLYFSCIPRIVNKRKVKREPEIYWQMNKAIDK